MPSEETKNKEVIEEKESTEKVIEKVEKSSAIDLSNGLPEEIKESKEVSEEDTNDDIFITENDTFEVSVEFYSNDGNLFVKSVDETDYDPINKDIRGFSATFKHPSQTDLETIMANVAYKSPENLTMHDIISLELVRMGILIRTWTLKQKINRIAELDPKIIKGLMNAVRDTIGLDGII